MNERHSRSSPKKERKIEHYPREGWQTYHNPEEHTILIEHKGAIFKFCKLLWSDQDASFYVIPYSANKRWDIGTVKFLSSRLEFEQDTPTELTTAPHLSFHQSGEVHIAGPKLVKGEVDRPVRHIPALHTLRGEHVLAFFASDFQCLPELSSRPKSTPKKSNFVIGVSGIKALQVHFFINAFEKAFPYFEQQNPLPPGGRRFARRGKALKKDAVDNLHRVICFSDRPTLRSPLYVNFQYRGRPTKVHPGVTFAAGWAVHGHNIPLNQEHIAIHVSPE